MDSLIDIDTTIAVCTVFLTSTLFILGYQKKQRDLRDMPHPIPRFTFLTSFFAVRDAGDMPYVTLLIPRHPLQRYIPPPTSRITAPPSLS
jgi:hypothetical protein